MKTMVCVEPGRIEYQFRPQVQQIENHAIIKIKRIGICGTDLHAFEGTQPFLSYPRILGHELSGELVSFDSAPGFEINENVSFIPYYGCGNCIACTSGRTNCCKSMEVCGVHIDGGMAEYLSVPSKSLVKSHGLQLDQLALVEPLAVAAHGVTRAGIQAGEFVLVMGAGPIGLGAIEFARLAGGKIIVLDIDEHRLEFCSKKLKVEHALNGKRLNVETAVKEITSGDMASVIIDATGNLAAINSAFQLMAHGGRYVLIGLQRDNIVINHPEFHKKEGTLMSSRNATRDDFIKVVTAVKEKLVTPSMFITHRVHFDDAASQFKKWLVPETGVIKAMIEM